MLKRQLRRYALWSALCAAGMPVSHVHAEDAVSFAVISHAMRAGADDNALRQAIRDSNAENLAFVVVNGVKSAQEPCTDRLYAQRKALLEGAKSGVILSLAGSDWIECGSGTQLSVLGRLNRLRETFFDDGFSIGASKLPLVRQSLAPRFRSYAENARWEAGNILFATLDLPRNNNHYLLAAGRNSEFEDRLVANRSWLHHIVVHATRRKTAAIVLFTDGDPLSIPARGVDKRDGFLEIRRQIQSMAQKYPGRILIVHAANHDEHLAPAIRWLGNIGSVGIPPGWMIITANASDAGLFTLDKSGPVPAGPR